MQEGNGSPAPAVSPRSAKTAGRDATPLKAEIKAIKESRNLDAIPDGISEKKKAIAAYMREHPEVTSKSAIAKAVGTDRNTVRKYYDEIRSELGLK
jgi:response regulator of citrate/malate metabolism